MAYFQKKDNRKVYQSLALVTQFSINMLVPIFLCLFLGIFIDRKLGTGFFAVILFFVGALAGFRNVYIFARTIYDDKDNKKSKDGDDNEDNRHDG